MLDFIQENRLTKVLSLLAVRGFIAPLSGGAVSVRSGENFIITSDDFNPYEISSKDLLTVDIKTGEPLSQYAKCNSNRQLHSMIYQKRDDVNVIVFGIPHYSTLLSASNTTPKTDLFVQAWSELGEVRKCSYASEGSSVLSARIVEDLQRGNAVLIENYGVIVTGKDLLSAFYRLELLEKVSKMTFELNSPKIKQLSPRQKIEIRSIL